MNAQDPSQFSKQEEKKVISYIFAYLANKLTSSAITYAITQDAVAAQFYEEFCVEASDFDIQPPPLYSLTHDPVTNMNIALKFVVGELLESISQGAENALGDKGKSLTVFVIKTTMGIFIPNMYDDANKETFFQRLVVFGLGGGLPPDLLEEVVKAYKNDGTQDELQDHLGQLLEKTLAYLNPALA